MFFLLLTGSIGFSRLGASQFLSLPGWKMTMMSYRMIMITARCKKKACNGNDQDDGKVFHSTV